MELKQYLRPIVASTTVVLALAGGLTILTLHRTDPDSLQVPPVYAGAYLALFQLNQKQDFEQMHDQLSGLQSLGQQLERRFRVNPAQRALAAVDRRDASGTVPSLQELVLLDIQQRLAIAQELVRTHPENALEALRTARMNYQVLALYTPNTNDELNEAVKRAFLTTIMSVKTEGATPNMLRTYTNEIQSKLHQLYPAVRFAMASSPQGFY